MKSTKLFFCIALFILLHGCKKEEVNPQTFVQQHLVGKWPLKFKISTTYTNNIAGNPDTLKKYDPIDTLVFTADGKYQKRNKTVITSGSFSIDEKGENITFSGNPAVTQKFSYVRNTSIGLIVSETTTATGKTVIIDQLKKN